MKYNFNELIEKPQKIILQDPTYTCIVNAKGYLCNTYTTCKGDEIKAEFYTAKKQEYSQVFSKIWDLIKDQYTLIPETHLITLPAPLYWNIYKKQLYGKEFIKHVGILTNCLWINGVNYTFPQPEDYFKNSSILKTVRGVYAIKKGEEIIYIGSSSTNVIDRWKEHVQCFLNRSPLNDMYSAIEDTSELNFELIYSDDDINNMFPVKVSQVSAEMIQYTEQLLIKTYRPVFNKEGKTTPFIYRAGPQLAGIDPDYLKIVQDFLINCEKETPEDIKKWFIEKYGEYIYNQFKDLT